MSKHVIKYTHKDGEELRQEEYWCGRLRKSYQWRFTDAQHVALAVGGSAQPCKNCIKAIIKELNKELEG